MALATAAFAVSCVLHVICVASIGAYAMIALGLSQAKPAFWFLVMPLLSLALTGITLLVAARRSRVGDA